MPMGQTWESRDDGNTDRERLTGSDLPSGQGTPRPEPETDLEAGWCAAHALVRVRGEQLYTVMMRPSFRAVREKDLVPISRCQTCQDGGLRVAGSVRTRHGRQPVRACDTCGTVVIGEAPPAQQ